MSKWTEPLLRWLPAVFMMATIFILSAQPSSNLPNFDWADRIVKKGGHMLGYALLALSYWRIFNFRREKRGWAWLLAILYAASDEIHQLWVSGRGASVFDVIVFDNVGALIALWLAGRLMKSEKLHDDDPTPVP